MRLKLEDGLSNPIKKEEFKEVVFKDTIKLESKEAREKITYKDSDGNCTFLLEGKEVDGIILTITSRGDMTIGIKEV